MNCGKENIVVSLMDRPQNEWAGLIHKLRRIGLDNEACRLERAVRALPLEEGGALSTTPSSTD